MNTNTVESKTLHGVFIDVLDCGVLITGSSGIGKSELALNLITRGYKLIADDIVTLERSESGKIIGRCDEVLQNFLEVRGLGILNIQAMYGDDAITKSKPLDLIVHLITSDQPEMYSIDRINGLRHDTEILDQVIPKVVIPVVPGRNLASLVDAAVRDHQLKQQGYDAGADFSQRQSSSIKER